MLLELRTICGEARRLEVDPRHVCIETGRRRGGQRLRVWIPMAMARGKVFHLDRDGTPSPTFEPYHPVVRWEVLHVREAEAARTSLVACPAWRMRGPPRRHLGEPCDAVHVR